MRNLQLPGRSCVHAANGMAATAHPLATNCALKVLQSGGNAVDAAIAAAAVLAVVEPHMTGIGGDCFVIVSQPDGTLHGLNGSGRSAAKARLGWYLERKITSLSDLPAHTITVPGALKAWEALQQRFGTREFNSLFADGIWYGKNGYPIAPRVARDWQGLAEKLAGNEGASAHFLVGGKPPEMGDIHRLPALAGTLESVASEGVDAFYTGPVAAEIAITVQQEGGFLSAEDIAGATADWVDPVSTTYGGYDVHEIPPNGQGITALVLLNLFDRLGAKNLAPNSGERGHLEIEAARLAYSVRDVYVGDPAAMRATPAQLLSRENTGLLATQFDAEIRNDNITMPSLPDASTTYLTVVDRDLMAVSFINSLYHGFGSGIATLKSGVCLQDRGACFSLQEGHDNAIGPSKRPMHTIIPGMVTKNGELSHSFGVMGGAFQPMGHAHVLANMFDYNMDPQEALDHGRVFWGEDGVVEFEAGVGNEVRAGLKARGHPIRPALSPLGAGQIIAVDHRRGVLIGASDPRKDGMAAGY